MQENGKILFYNANEGKGIIITQSRQKFDFSVTEWNDFETLPQVGAAVSFELDGQNAVNITSGSSAPQQKARKAPASSKPSVIDQKAVFERPNFIRLQMDVDDSIRNYFNAIEESIQQRTGYQSATGRLDFLRIRRFLFTMFNNLCELDMHFITPEIHALYDELVEMGKVYDDYKIKNTYPEIAFDKVFLSFQKDYVAVRHDAQTVFSELQRLRSKEDILSRRVAEKEEVLDRTLRTSTQFERLDEEFKDLKKYYVDTVHEIATLDEQYKQDLRLMSDFEKQHSGEFFERFAPASKKYRTQILHILDVLAYQFDTQLWKQAQRSKVIRKFFEDSRIEGDYCAKTYLRYYLNTLDPEKISVEQQALFDLYEYLESMDHDAVMILVQDIDDALRMKYLFSQMKLSITVEAFVDENKAIKWAKENSANIIIIEDQLQKMSAMKFLNEYKKRVSLQLKILYLSNEKEPNLKIPVDAVLPKGFTNAQIKDVIDEFLKKEN